MRYLNNWGIETTIGDGYPVMIEWEPVMTDYGYNCYTLHVYVKNEQGEYTIDVTDLVYGSTLWDESYTKAELYYLEHK